MILSILSLVTACSTLTLQICIYRRMIRAEQKPAEPEETPEPKNPDKIGLYDDFRTEAVQQLIVDERGLFCVAHAEPQKGVQRVFCSHMLDFCTDRCMCFESSWNRDKNLTMQNFQCGFLPIRYVAKSALRHMSHA
jgi:hypothetical protein